MNESPSFVIGQAWSGEGHALQTAYAQIRASDGRNLAMLIVMPRADGYAIQLEAADGLEFEVYDTPDDCFAAVVPYEAQPADL